MIAKAKDIRWEQRFKNYEKSFKQFEQGVALKNPDVWQVQGVIQCFEYTFELAWKTLQDFLTQKKGYSDVKGPRPVLEQAFRDGMIADGETWFDMLRSRNLSTHLYDENEMRLIHDKAVQNYYKPFSELYQFFEKNL